jgi:hypothetical protein
MEAVNGSLLVQSSPIIFPEDKLIVNFRKETTTENFQVLFFSDIYSGPNLANGPTCSQWEPEIIKVAPQEKCEQLRALLSFTPLQEEQNWQ